MSKQQMQAVLTRYLPPRSLHYCSSLWAETPFDFTVTKKRETKLGDYSYCSKEKRHKITINGDVNEYSFLVTYIHEVAHYRTYLNHGFRVKPHGSEWKKMFSALMAPMLAQDIFPEDMMPALNKYFKNPKASSCSDIALLKALRSNSMDVEELFLGDIPLGQSFEFNGKVYVREHSRRTRSLCMELSSGKKYYISEGAPVIPLAKPAQDIF